MSDGSSLASLATLRKAAEIRAGIRQYMAEQGVLEVLTPALSAAAATDPGLDSLTVHDAAGSTRQGYLHTSPEFPMKRLLAQFAVDIYQIASVFRAGEAGRQHNPEFTLLEWYRMALDDRALIDDVLALLERLFVQSGKPWPAPQRQHYGALVHEWTAAYPEALDVPAIAAVFAHHDRSWPTSIGDDRDAALNLLVDEFVLPTLPADRVTVITDYPASQAALARVVERGGRQVAARFEVYVGTVELANGYQELTDADEQQQRFEQDAFVRRQRGLPVVPHDERLLEAMRAGLPECAGVALGIERLLMVLTDSSSIGDVMSFTSDCA